MRTLVLASTSPWRKSLLERLGLPFDTVDPGVDEAPYKQRGLAPEDLVVVLAEAKARAAADSYADALILGSDQVACVDGQILGKPGTVERACAQLRTLSGRTHRLLTGVAIHDTVTGATRTVLDVHEITVRELSDDAIRRYVEHDMPLACAGSYRLESLGIALFESVRGDDYTGVIGLPLTAVVRLLVQSGCDPLA